MICQVDRAKGKTLDEISAIVRALMGGGHGHGQRFISIELFDMFVFLFYMRVEHDDFLNGM